MDSLCSPVISLPGLHQVPITARWPETFRSEKFCPFFATQMNTDGFDRTTMYLRDHVSRANHCAIRATTIWNINNLLPDPLPPLLFPPY